MVRLANTPHGNLDDVAGLLSPAVIGLLPAALADAQERLLPMDPPALVARLSGALALVAGALDQALRIEWLAAAADEMSRVPADLAAAGIAHAKTKADHVSKIVVLALKHAEPETRQRQREAGLVEQLLKLGRTPTIAEPLHGSGFFDTTDPEQLLDSVRAQLTLGSHKTLAATPGGPAPLPYRDRSLRIEIPADSRASDALMRMVHGDAYQADDHQRGGG